MSTQVLLRDFTCAVCGAPRTTHTDALVVVCRHCGGILTSTKDGWVWVDVAERHAEAVRQLVKPSEASARLMALSLSMASAASDRVMWRLLCEEQTVLTPMVHPSIVPPLPIDPMKRAEYIEHAVAMAEICTFDPTVSGLMSRYGTACADFTTAPDAVAVARAMLEAARTYYRALMAHPDLPPGMLREGAEHHARELVRSGIAGYAPLIGEGVIERIRVDVLGDAFRPASDVRCPKCGGPLSARGDSLTRCPQCDAITSLQDDTTDAWMSARLGLWKITLDELVRSDRLDGASPVIAAIGSFLYTGAADVAVDKAVRFLGRAIPWVTRAELDQGIDILHHAVTDDPAKQALLEAIRAMTQSEWRSEPNARPVQSPPRLEPHPAPTAADEAAWIESALALYSFRRGSLLELLGQALGAMHIAAVHDQPAGVSPRAAMTFFERAVPTYDRAAMLVEVRKLQPGYDHPRLAAFTTELVQLLEETLQGRS